MSDLQYTYDKAVSKYESVRKKQQTGAAAPVGFTQESEYQSAFREMNKARKALIAAGQWDGPIPLPPRGHR